MAKVSDSWNMGFLLLSLLTAPEREVFLPIFFQEKPETRPILPFSLLGDPGAGTLSSVWLAARLYMPEALSAVPPGELSRVRSA